MYAFSHRLVRRFLVATIAAVVGVGGAIPTFEPTAAVGADQSSDIPGIPLPGPVAAGRLGGAIYDVVYRFTVAPGHVIVASLTGADGTDLDLYLFDASATTVLSEVGLLTKSTGPTSTESISWPSRLGGTFYIDLNGATDVEGDYRLTVQTLPDPSPPTVSVLLAGGRPLTNQLTVPVALAAADDLSGVTEMALSADGVTFEDWRPIASTSWTFPPGDGSKTLWAKVRNGVGLESKPSGDSIIVDTLLPSVVAIDPVGGSAVVGLRPTFSVSFDEPMDAASWIDLGLIVQSAQGALVSGRYTYNAATRTGSFVPSAALQAGAIYVVTVGNVTDLAGNRVGSPGSWSVTPLRPTTVQGAATSTVILRGRSTSVAVELDGAPLPATLEVLSATAPGGFVPFTLVSTDDGRTSIIVAPSSNTTYRFRYAGNGSVAPSQADVRVLVRRSIVLAGRTSGVTATARVGSSVKLTAAISPAAAGVSVSFRLYRFDSGRRAWVYAGSRGRSTDTAGRATYTWSPPSEGSWYWRAVVASTVDFANNSSPVYRWTIRR